MGAFDGVRIKKKVEKLLAMTEESGCTPAEAAQAASVARRLLAKRAEEAFSHGMPADPSPVTTVEADVVGSCRPWGEPLAGSIARSFRCKAAFVRDGRRGERMAAFFGHGRDAKAACSAFEELYSLGDRLGREAVEKTGEEASYEGMTAGFLLGVKRELARQSVILMMPVPDDVKAGFEKLGLEEADPGKEVASVDNVFYLRGLQLGADAMKKTRKVDKDGNRAARGDVGRERKER